MNDFLIRVEKGKIKTINVNGEYVEFMDTLQTPLWDIVNNVHTMMHYMRQNYYAKSLTLNLKINKKNFRFVNRHIFTTYIVKRGKYESRF